uniref:Uncharacterized protein n=1 Tax=Arundo donax TaxID=35708 RepID=A0A0A9FVT9_ARUDO
MISSGEGDCNVVEGQLHEAAAKSPVTLGPLRRRRIGEGDAAPRASRVRRLRRPDQSLEDGLAA